MWASHGGKTHCLLNVILVLTQAKRRILPRYQDVTYDFLREVKPLLINVNMIKHFHKRLLFDKAVTVRSNLFFGVNMGLILFFDNFRSPNFNARLMVVNSLAALDGHDRPLFNELL